MRAVPITADIEFVSAVLNDGGLAVVPTDTVYGIAASVAHPQAVEAIYKSKVRPEFKPIPLLVDTIESARLFVSTSNVRSEALMRAFWPGALTIIFPASDRAPAGCLAGGTTVGLRVPDHDLLRSLMTRCGGALAVTSANLSGAPETRTAEAAIASLRGQIDVALDSGPSKGGSPSTVVDPFPPEMRILRQGGVDTGSIRTVLAGIGSC